MKPLLSVDNNEARLRVLSLYKAWSRQLPFMVSEFDIPVNEVQAKAKLREKFMANAHVKDARVIDMMVIKVSSNPCLVSRHSFLYGLFLLGTTRFARSC